MKIRESAILELEMQAYPSNWTRAYLAAALAAAPEREAWSLLEQAAAVTRDPRIRLAQVWLFDSHESAVARETFLEQVRREFPREPYLYAQSLSDKWIRRKLTTDEAVWLIQEHMKSPVLYTTSDRHSQVSALSSLFDALRRSL